MPAHADGQAETARRSAIVLIPVLLVLATLAVYGQVWGHRFVAYDDDVYVTANPHVLRGVTWDGIVWAFTTLDVSNWHPLTWISHMVDVELFGTNPGAHHLVNVGIHVLNALLLLGLFREMTGAPGRSAMVAALFALHPLHVESVAWVAERKDLLSTLFLMLSLRAYIPYARQPRAGRLLPVAVLFALGLMCKPMLVTMPFLLLLLDYWPLRRAESFFGGPSPPPPSGPRVSTPGLLTEKIPLLVLSAGSCVVTYVAQVRGGSLDPVPFAARAVNAAVSYGSYVVKTVLPASLAVFYPYPVQSGIGWQAASAGLLIAAASAAAIVKGRTYPWLAVGWFWFAGTLVPVIGLVQVGAQAMADRYTYVPLIGLFIVAAWGGHALLDRARAGRRAAWAASLAVLVVLAGMTWRQAGHWKSTGSLFRRAVAVTRDNWLAENGLAIDCYAKGDMEGAFFHAREALRIRPRLAEAWLNLGNVYRDTGRLAQAFQAYSTAVRFKPDSPAAWTNLGNMYSQRGQVPQAVDAYRAALRLRPDYDLAWFNLGATFANSGREGPAIDAYRELLRINPDHVAAWFELGALYASQGRWDEAAGVHDRLRTIDPGKAAEFSARVLRRR